MKSVKVTIEGVTPLICNKFHDAAQISASGGTRISTVGDRGTPREQAELKLYTGVDGNLIIPQPNLYRCLIDGGTFFKSGKSKITTLKSSLIPSCVDLGPIELPLISKEGWCVDTRAVRIPSTGGRILAHRPVFNDWKIEFDLEIDTDLIAIKLIRDILDASGKRIGLGDFRPACKGPFGKFVVTDWKEV